MMCQVRFHPSCSRIESTDKFAVCCQLINKYSLRLTSGSPRLGCVVRQKQGESVKTLQSGPDPSTSESESTRKALSLAVQNTIKNLYYQELIMYIADKHRY